MNDRDDAAVQEALREGQHARAAELCLEQGAPARAARILADAWQWSDAVRVARDAALHSEAYGHALESGDPVLIGDAFRNVLAHSELCAAAARKAEAKARWREAGVLWAESGEHDRSLENYERARAWADAASLALQRGDRRKAGRYLEKRIAEAPEDRESRATLAEILSDFALWEHALRAASAEAAKGSDAPAIRMRRARARAFRALGMEAAARTETDALAALEEKIPGASQGIREHETRDLLLGRYRVIRALGAGGIGRVVLAWDVLLERNVAVKSIDVGASSRSGRDALRRFEREARIATSLDHPNIVRTFAFDPEGPLLVMEWMEGETLDQRLSRMGVLSPETAREVSLRLLSALEVIHTRGVVHRDIKPANVFWTSSGEIKLGDFGSSHLVELGGTLTGDMLGSLAFMAPEQITASRNPDASTDLYALGILLFRMLTGTLPFPGPDFVSQQLEQSPPNLCSSAPWLDVEFDALVRKALRKDLEERWKDVENFRSALRGLDWAGAERRYADAQPTAEIAPRASDSSASFEGSRYVPLDPAHPSVYRDSWLERCVDMEPCDVARLPYLRAWARIACAELQGIWDIDQEREVAVLESWSASSASSNEPFDARARLRAALASLHGEGLVHGSIDTEHVNRSRPRLRVPRTLRTTTPSEDIHALELLFEDP